MKRWAILALAVAVFGPAVPAQAQVNFGPQLAWGDDTDLGIGGRIDFGVANALGVNEGAFRNLFASTSVTYFFIDCDECSYFEMNGNLAVPFELDGSSIAPYAGAGIHIGRFSYDGPGDEFFDGDDTEVGLNLLGGIFFPLSDLRGFVDGKFALAGTEQFVLSAGVLF